MDKHELMLHSLDEQLQKMLYPQGRTVEVQPMSDYRESMGVVLLYSADLSESRLAQPYQYESENDDWEYLCLDGRGTFEAVYFCAAPAVVLPEGLD